MTQPDEKQHARRSERIRVALEIRYRSAGAFLVSYSVNLSHGGLFIETETPLPQGDRIDLKLLTPKEQTIELSGVVAWVRGPNQASPGEPPGMGISVETPEESYGVLIDDMASKFSGLKVLLALGPGQDRARAVLKRHMAAIVACKVVDVDDAYYPQDDALFDLALVNLDWIEGEDVVGRIRDGQRPVPLIALGHSTASRRRGNSLGALASLDNPPSFSELRASVIAALTRPESVSA
ncbi:MAG: TIGR02266 family protein [Myxococcales bacterium]|nr:TIGR02266 family protein [Myxococcales bacterium]